MSESIIKTESLKVIYNEGKSNEVRSLDDVNVEIFPEEYIVIHGPSGCGKSTLLYSIAGLQAPTSGKVFLSSKDISNMKEKEKVALHRTGVGMIFQAFYLIESLSVIDNVCLPQTFMSESPRERKERGMELLRRFGIMEQADKLPAQLSGGQKQRVAIARALINNPEIILADEPVGNLDSESALNVLNIIKELNEIDKKTIILVTHNVEHLNYADRAIIMKDGKIVREQVNKEKRNPEKMKESGSEQAEQKEIPNDLNILMRTFKDLSANQVGSLLVPYKAKQLLFYAVSDFNEDQFSAAEGFLKEMLFRNIDEKLFEKKLDSDFEKGGANWDSRRAKSISGRIEDIVKQSQLLDEKNSSESAVRLGNYLENYFDIVLDEKEKELFNSILKMRIENSIGRDELKTKLDENKNKGGLGLYKNTAERISREVEMMMLLKYSTS